VEGNEEYIFLKSKNERLRDENQKLRTQACLYATLNHHGVCIIFNIFYGGINYENRDEQE